MPRGGYQKPSNPAVVSGPGALSQRTDGGPGQTPMDLPDAKYGEAKAFADQQAGAPLAQAPSMPEVIPLDAPTTRPDEPVTAGAPLGPGPGAEILQPVQAAPQTVSDRLFAMAAGDLSGVLAQLADVALQRGI